jgi:peptidoglycan/LPS O-acetylase OafA/YrhL
MERLPALDGLRAISILLVVIGHAATTAGFPLPPGAHWYRMAHLGVAVFFVISGYLISHLLLREKAAMGKIALGRFYARRALRIMPAFYAYLAVVAVLIAGGYWLPIWSDWWQAACYLKNLTVYRPHLWAETWSVAHTWSLAMEEQFYLAWPAILAFCARRHLAAILAVAFVLFPMVAWAPLHPMTSRTLALLVNGAYLVVGCSLAVHAEAWKRSANGPIAGLSLAYLLATLFVDSWDDHPVSLYAKPVAVAMLVLYAMAPSSGWLRRALQASPLVWLGGLSYSLYLWQQPFFDRAHVAWYTAFPQNLGFALLVAVFSQRLIERPFLKLKQRFQAVSAAEPMP